MNRKTQKITGGTTAELDILVARSGYPRKQTRLAELSTSGQSPDVICVAGIKSGSRGKTLLMHKLLTLYAQVVPVINGI